MDMLYENEINTIWAPNGHLSVEQRDWFIDFFIKNSPKYCLEIGFAGGRHTSTLLHSTIPEKLVSVDINFDYGDGRIYVDKLKNKFENIEFYEANSNMLLTTEFIESIFPNGIDYAFVDGGHTYSECMLDMENCWKFINENGVMLVDDYQSGGPVGVSIADVDKAVDEFAEKYAIHFDKVKLSDGKGMAKFIKSKSVCND